MPSTELVTGSMTTIDTAARMLSIGMPIYVLSKDAKADYPVLPVMRAQNEWLGIHFQKITPIDDNTFTEKDVRDFAHPRAYLDEVDTSAFRALNGQDLEDGEEPWCIEETDYL